MPLPRYGIQWNGPDKPIADETADGYWTPWHLAASEIERLSIEVDVQSYWGPRWEAEHNEVIRLRKLLEDNGIAA